MASVFSSPVASFHYSSDLYDHLIQPSRAHHGFLSSHHILNASVMVGLIRSLIAPIVTPLIRNAPHLIEPRRVPPTGPQGNQGGFHDIL